MVSIDSINRTASERESSLPRRRFQRGTEIRVWLSRYRGCCWLVHWNRTSIFVVFKSVSCLIINMLSEACYGILLHAFRRQSCRTRLNTDLRSDLSCSYTLVHKWFLDLPLMARDFALRPKMCRPALHLCIPPRCAAHEKKIIGPEHLGTHQSPIWWAHGDVTVVPVSI